MAMEMGKGATPETSKPKPMRERLARVRIKKRMNWKVAFENWYPSQAACFCLPRMKKAMAQIIPEMPRNAGPDIKYWQRLGIIPVIKSSRA